jgi:hypothetical protein
MRLTRGVVMVVLAASPCAFPQGGVLARKTADGRIVFQAVEAIQINGSRQVRLMPPGTVQVTPNDAKRYPKLSLGQIGTIRADSTHRLVRLDADAKPDGTILPENFAPKAAVEAGAAAGRLAIEVLTSKKGKKGEIVTPEEFFAFLSGTDPNRLLLDFVSRAAVFASRKEQLLAMEGLAASLPDWPATAELRETLRSRIADTLTDFENKGPFSNLLDAREYSDTSVRAFPNDAPLAELRRQVVQKIDFIVNSGLVLRSLAASGDWDVLLDKYLAFERYQWSFPDLMQLRQAALEESARSHAGRARLLAVRQLHADALREATRAAQRDPDNTEIARLLESEKVLLSQADARRAAASRRALPKDSPEDRRFRRNLYNAEQSVRDKDYAKAETSIKAAEAENPGAPETLLCRAQLAAALDRHAEALPLLDQYDRAVSDPLERAAGEKVRNQVLYEFEKKKTAVKHALAGLGQAGEYSQLRTAIGEALKLDAADDDFLYLGGATAAALGDKAAAKDLLQRYLSRSVSLRGDLERRDRAFRILAALDPPARPESRGALNWLSGRPVPSGAFYCPLSASFQLPIDSVAGYKLRMSFQWNQGRLLSIATSFEDDKGLQNYRALSGAAEASGQFYFEYAGEDPQVQAVSARKPEKNADFRVLRVTRQGGAAHLVDDRGRPRIVLRQHAQFDIATLSLLEGVTGTGIAGNSVFNPFIWDGVHYFSLTWDRQGRLDSAREWGVDNLVRFTWSGDRLMKISAYRKDSAAPYYERTIAYSGAQIAGESYSAGNRSGRVKYVYNGSVLQQIQIEDGGVHDGKKWIVRPRS